MRNQLLAAAAILALATASPAFAQSSPQSGTQAPGAPSVGAPAVPQTGPMGVAPAEITPGHGTQPATTGTTSANMAPSHQPAAGSASNITPADTRSDIAPKLPSPGLGPNASPADFLRQAQNALRQHRSGEAQEALERAETRLLDRSTIANAADTPDTAPAIRLIAQARDAIGRRDWSQANRAIADAIKAPMAMRASDANGPT